MRTDARDRFGTPLEQRFTRQQIVQMLERCGLVDIRFSEAEPYWCAVGTKTAATQTHKPKGRAESADSGAEASQGEASKDA